MYLSNENNFKLDEIVKSFEVALRGKISSSLYLRYPTLSDFSIGINKVAATFIGSSAIFSRKFKAKSDKIAKEVATHYQKIEESNAAYLSQSYQEAVPYLSDLIDYMSLFFNEGFQNLASNFTTIEEFYSFSAKYLTIRNALSHPASARIKIQDAEDILFFIKSLCQNIEDDKFWYANKITILAKIEELTKNLTNSVIKVHNLDEVSFPHGKIVCRDAELEFLKNCLLGKDLNYRKSGSVVIYGYGGVGKTALILEFIYQILKEINDKKINTPYDFILFFTGKEETLLFKQTSGEAYIDILKKQISSFKEFQDKLTRELEQGDIKSLADSKGLIVIDNFETLPNDDKEKLIEFTKQSPRSVQFVLTSRNEENCEDKLNVKGFKEIDAGLKFINQYIQATDIKLQSYFSDFLRKELVELSKGNTLIIVLTIQQLTINNNLSQIFSDLRSVESSNMEVIADFMYKNTIQKTIEDLKRQHKDPVSVLKIISLFGAAIDLYSISTLTDMNISDVEYICNTFTSRLVLEKSGESYEPNQFANKFILLKYLPNNIEKKVLKDKIRDYQKHLREKLDKLERTKQKDRSLREIMDDWKPKHVIDKIAIAESYGLFAEFRHVNENIRFRQEKIARVIQKFDQIEKMTSHPYIRFQKARFFIEVYKTERDKLKREEFKNAILNSYEEAIMTTTFYYGYIRHTKSFASINWKFGLFYWSVLYDYANSARYLEDAVEIFRIIGRFDKTFHQVQSDLSYVYMELYFKTNDVKYKDGAKEIFYNIKKEYSKIKQTGFEIDKYLKIFVTKLKARRRTQTQ